MIGRNRPGLKTRASIAAIAALILVAANAATAVAQTATDERARALIGMGRVKRDAGDAAAARRYFEEAAAIRPLAGTDRIEYFWILSGHDAKAALATGRAVLAATPTQSDVRDRMITEAMSVGDESAVVELAEGGQRTEPQLAKWPRRIGESQLRQNNPQAAAAAFARATTLNGAAPDDQAWTALALEASKQYALSAEAWAKVSASLRASRPEFERSRLRAIAFGAPGAETAEILDQWIVAHPADAEVRSLAIDAWTHAGQPARAVTIASALSQQPNATAADRLLCIDLLTSNRDARAPKAIDAYVAQYGCDERVLAQADRIGDPAGTETLVRLLNTKACKPTSRWIARGIERTVAVGNHTVARALLARLPAADANQLPMKRLAGQLALWTGHAAEAVPALEDVVRRAPADKAARQSLIDAYRAVGRPRDAWTLAEPLTQQPDGPERLLAYADLALDADCPEAVAAIVDRVPQSSMSATRTRLLGRSKLAGGQPAEALRLLSSLDPHDLDAAAAVALIDSRIAVSGVASALESSRLFAADAPVWRDVVVRQYVIESIAGDANRASAKRRVLNDWDSQAALIADVEIAMARQQPQAALASLAKIDATHRTEHVRDLESLALAGVGRNAEALALTSRLRTERPDSFNYQLREADLAHRVAPTAATRARIEALAAVSPDNRDAASLLAHVRATDADGWAVTARQQFNRGNRTAAHDAAERVVAIDASKSDAWMILVQLAAADGAQELSKMLPRLSPIVHTQPDFAPAIADTLSGFVKQPGDAVATEIVKWIDGLPSLPAGPSAKLQLSRARVLAAAQQWDAALTSIDAALAADASNLAALRLKADVLSWSGRHDEGLAAYDVYLAKQPDDLDAARQQARVMGWAGRFNEAKRRYALLASNHPDVKVISAESAAKTAFFDGRWTDAATAYARWLALEPNNGEAAFERAQSLRAAGHLADADAALRALAASGGHQLAAPAWDRVQVNRKPAVTATTDSKSSDGYQGRRLLDTQMAGGAFRATAGQGRAAFNVDASYVRMSGGDATSRGYRVGGATTLMASDSIAVRGQASAWSLDTSAGVIPEYLARVDWRPIDRWTIGVGSDRSLLLENLDVVDRGLAATGLFGAARFDSPVSSLDVTMGWHHLSDDNGRMRASVSYGRRLSERTPDLRMLVWSEALMFRESSDAYYSPARQVRVDAGLQYTHNFETPRFAQDLRKRLSMGYLVGTDRDGVVYHHPTFNFTCEFANGLALVARGDWIRSEVYNERSMSVHVTVTPNARVIR